jgi:Holliday junction resolvasome RuvABC endonuclease subunit
VIIACFDAGFVNLGWVVAEIRKREEPTIVDFGVWSFSPLSPKERKRRGLAVAHQNVARIQEQAECLVELHRTHQPSGYFVEVPHGGAKGAIAIRSMAYATATIATALKVLAPETPAVFMLPSDIKELVGGKLAASKEMIASAVRNFWPDINWDAFGARSDNATDAAAVCLAARFHPTYKALVSAC